MDAHPEGRAPIPPWERPRAPWKPRVAGITSFFFGPVAGGLVTFLNLRRLGAPRKAAWILGLSALGSVLLGSLSYWMEEYLELLAAPLSACVFPPLQKAEFDAWRGRNPDVPLQSGWRSVGWGALGTIAMFPLFSLGLAPWLLTEEVRHVEIEIQVPELDWSLGDPLGGGEVHEAPEDAEACQELADRMAARGLDRYAVEIRKTCPD